MDFFSFLLINNFGLLYEIKWRSCLKGSVKYARPSRIEERCLLRYYHNKVTVSCPLSACHPLLEHSHQSVYKCV